MRIDIILILSLLCFFNESVSAATSSFKCGNRIVSLGNTKAEVVIKCGTPAWKDAWSDDIVRNVNKADQFRISVERERWIYNFGPNAFLQIILFENGKLMNIATGDYGYDERRARAGPCDIINIQTGLTQFEVQRRCGTPFFTDTRHEDSIATVDGTTTRLTTKRIDEWTYNRGPNEFLRILTFENGILANVRTGERGM